MSETIKSNTIDLGKWNVMVSMKWGCGWLERIFCMKFERVWDTMTKCQELSVNSAPIMIQGKSLTTKKKEIILQNLENQ